MRPEPRRADPATACAADEQAHSLPARASSGRWLASLARVTPDATLSAKRQRGRRVAFPRLRFALSVSADPEVFAWNIKNCGPDVDLLVDQSQIVQLEDPESG